MSRFPELDQRDFLTRRIASTSFEPYNGGSGRPPSVADLARPAPAPTAPAAPKPGVPKIGTAPATQTFVAAPPVRPPSRLQEADLIMVRTEASNEILTQRQNLRAMTMAPRGQRDQQAINQTAARIRELQRQGAAADRALRDLRRPQTTPEEIALSQARLQGQYQALREGAVIRARVAEDRARADVNARLAAGGAAGDITPAQQSLNSAIAAREQAEARPPTLTFETPSPEEVARREQVRTARIATDEAIIQETLARREQTGSTLPLSIQEERNRQQELRRAQHEATIRGLSGTNPIQDAQINLANAQAGQIQAEAGLTAAETERVRTETGRIGSNDDLARRRGEAEIGLLESQRNLTDAQVRSAIAQIDDNAVVARVTRAAEQDEAIFQARPELAAVAQNAADAFVSATGQTFQIGTANRTRIRGQIEALRALPETERRVVYRRIWQGLVSSGNLDLAATPRGAGDRTTIVGNAFSRINQTFSEWFSVSDREAREGQIGLQQLLNEFGQEIVRIGGGGQ